MDVMMLPKKKKMFDCKYAAPSPMTRKFVAHVYGADEKEIRETLTEPGPIVVYNPDTGSHAYEGYKTVEEIREQERGFVAVLTREGPEHAPGAEEGKK